MYIIGEIFSEESPLIGQMFQIETYEDALEAAIRLVYDQDEDVQREEVVAAFENDWAYKIGDDSMVFLWEPTKASKHMIRQARLSNRQREKEDA